MNCSLLKVMRSGSGRTWSFLNSGSLVQYRSYKKVPDTILIAAFCILKSSLIGPDLIQIFFNKNCHVEQGCPLCKNVEKILESVARSPTPQSPPP